MRTRSARRAGVGRMRLAAFVAGVIYAFASNRAIYAALGHYDMVTTQWLPFYALYLFRTLRRPTLRNGALAGALLRAGGAGRDDLRLVPGAVQPDRPDRLVGASRRSEGRAQSAGRGGGHGRAALVAGAHPGRPRVHDGRLCADGLGRKRQAQRGPGRAGDAHRSQPAPQRTRGRPDPLDAGVATGRRGPGALLRYQHGVSGLGHAGAGGAGRVDGARARPRMDVDGVDLRRAGVGAAVANQRALPVQPGRDAPGRRDAPVAVHPAALYPGDQCEPRAEPQ